MQYDSIIFDLDGTLWNAASASAKGWNEGFKELGFQGASVSGKDIESVAGKPFEECVLGLFPDIDLEKYPTLYNVLNKHEEEHVKRDGGVLYDGVKDGLLALSKHYGLYLVSNCQVWYLENFISFSQLGGVFKDVECYGRTKSSKAINLKDVIKRNNLNAPVYVGDTYGDLTSAKEVDVDFMCAAYGFGKDLEAKASFDSFNELSSYFLTQVDE